jgi:hypothetical protein
MTKSSRFIEYMKVHLISLEQDRDETVATVGEESVDWEFVSGQIHATQHLLSVALDIMEQSNQGEWAINE